MNMVQIEWDLVQWKITENHILKKIGIAKNDVIHEWWGQDIFFCKSSRECAVSNKFTKYEMFPSNGVGWAWKKTDRGPPVYVGLNVGLNKAAFVDNKHIQCFSVAGLIIIRGCSVMLPGSGHIALPLLTPFHTVNLIIADFCSLSFATVMFNV